MIGKLACAAVVVPAAGVVAVAAGVSAPDQAAALTISQCQVSAASAGQTSAVGSAAPGVAGAAPTSIGSTTLTAAQVGNAQLVVATVRGMGIPERGAEIAVATAWTESHLTNSGEAVDHDSVGLFQQRPSQGWGTVAELTQPVIATQKFAARMVQVPNWQSSDPGAVAQAVQGSAYPDRYDAIGWPIGLPLADALWTGSSTQVSCSSPTGPASSSPAQTTGAAKVVLDRAYSMLGKAYCWAAGDGNGATHGAGGGGCPAGVVGFDCSGLALYAWAPYVTLPHSAAEQYNLGTKVPIAQAQPGDLVFWQNSTDGIHHVALIWSADGDGHGGGQIIEAQDFDVPVHIRAFRGDLEHEVLPYAVRLTPQATSNQ